MTLSLFKVRLHGNKIRRVFTSSWCTQVRSDMQNLQQKVRRTHTDQNPQLPHLVPYYVNEQLPYPDLYPNIQVGTQTSSPLLLIYFFKYLLSSCDYSI